MKSWKLRLSELSVDTWNRGWSRLTSNDGVVMRKTAIDAPFL